MASKVCCWHCCSLTATPYRELLSGSRDRLVRVFAVWLEGPLLLLTVEVESSHHEKRATLPQMNMEAHRGPPIEGSS